MTNRVWEEKGSTHYHQYQKENLWLVQLVVLGCLVIAAILLYLGIEAGNLMAIGVFVVLVTALSFVSGILLTLMIIGRFYTFERVREVEKATIAAEQTQQHLGVLGQLLGLQLQQAKVSATISGDAWRQAQAATRMMGANSMPELPAPSGFRYAPELFAEGDDEDGV